ncbi:MAG: hypothetical protein IH851_06390 [Armatimonadetes bacterium]|nr:hypothetical protein [Armatimonadota bacterium]
MLVIPEIRLTGGRALGPPRRGRRSPDGDPETAAEALEEAGARWLHVLDLDAEREGGPQNVQALHLILKAVNVPVQFEGGIRLMHTAELVLGLGVARVVVSDALTKSERSAGFFFKRLGDRCVARVPAAGTETEQMTLALRLEAEGAPRMIYAGQGKGGLGPDRVERFAGALKVPLLIDLTGVSAWDPRNLSSLKSVEIEGAIVQGTHFGPASEAEPGT